MPERIPFLWNRNALSLHSLAHILIDEPASISPEYALRCGSISPPETGSPHVARNRPPQSARPSADRPRGPAPDPPQRAPRADLGPRAGLRAGQSGDPAQRSGERFPPLLPTQPETLSAARGFGAGRPSPALARRGPRHPHGSRPL